MFRGEGAGAALWRSHVHACSKALFGCLLPPVRHVLCVWGGLLAAIIIQCMQHGYIMLHSC